MLLLVGVIVVIVIVIMVVIVIVVIVVVIIIVIVIVIINDAPTLVSWFTTCFDLNRQHACLSTSFTDKNDIDNNKFKLKQ